MFPYNENSAKKVQQDFVANGIRRDDEELDLGPGLAAIERDELGKQGKLRSFPRSRKVKQESIQKLGVEPPPLVKSLELDGASVEDTCQRPTLWMGTSSSDTSFHHDHC